MDRKQFAVIGLGRFGSSVAKTLYSLGNEVLAIDSEEDVVQEIADSVTHAVQLDATDENALRSLGIRNFDIAVVAIGSDIQSSIMVTLLVKEMGVKYLIAKANNDLHAKVLHKIGADRVVLPEKDMGVRVAHNLMTTNILDYIELSPDYSIAEMEVPEEWSGKTLRELDLRVRHGVNVMAIKRENSINISPSAGDRLLFGDVIVAIGGTEELSRLENKITV